MNSEVIKSLEVFEKALNAGFDGYREKATHENIMSLISIVDRAVETITVLHSQLKQYDIRERQYDVKERALTALLEQRDREISQLTDHFKKTSWSSQAENEKLN